MNACSSTRMHGASRSVCSRPEVVGEPTMCVVRCSRAKLVISHARAEPNWSAARKRPMWNHPRQSPTIHPSLSYFPVFSSPTATLEVVGNTGNMSSEKAGVGGSTPSLATIVSITCTSRISLFGCNWLQFLIELQLIRLLRPLSFSTTRC